MRHIYTYDEIKQAFKNKGYILLTDHKVKSDEKYEYICEKHQDKGSQFIDWGHFYCSGRGCYYCGRERTEMARRKDFDKYDGRALAESKGFEYIGMSKHNKKVWVQFICPKHRQYGVQEMPYNNMKRIVIGCQHCIGRNDDKNEVLKEMYKVNPYIELLEPYQGRAKRVKMYCRLHNMVSYKTPHEVIMGKGCMQCGVEKLSQQAKLSEDAYVQRLNRSFPHIKLIGGYDGITRLAEFHCDNCSTDFIDYANYISRRGCPICNSTSMECKIGEILAKHNIIYKPQFSFADCKDQRALPFDFYLLDYNILIEYDGQQHYQPVNFGGIDDAKALKNFKTTQRHDDIKTQYCQNNNIPLIRIPYWDSANIEQIILDNIKCITQQND